VPAWTIRTATHEDIDAVLSLWLAAGAVAAVGAHREGLAKLLAADERALLVAATDAAVIGSLIAAWDGWRGSFYRLAVHPDWRRRGLATALVRAGERRLREHDAERLTAIVADDDPGALDFWTAAGYERQRDRTRFVRAAQP
jgi:ribosomal protein S18 acetylase RimI-like enzyme